MFAIGVVPANGPSMAPAVVVRSVPASFSIRNTFEGFVTSIRSRSQSSTVAEAALFGAVRAVGVPAQLGSTANVLRLNAVEVVLASVDPMTYGAVELSMVSELSLRINRRSQAAAVAEASWRRQICQESFAGLNVIGNGE